MTDVDDELWDDFHAAVTMTSRELRDWLAVEGAGEDAEALPDQAGPHLGRRVLEILGKRRGDLTDDDVEVMQTVVRVVQREHPDPDVPISDDHQRRRLMDLGHDPLRDPGAGTRS